MATSKLNNLETVVSELKIENESLKDVNRQLQSEIHALKNEVSAVTQKLVSERSPNDGFQTAKGGNKRAQKQRYIIDLSNRFNALDQDGREGEVVTTRRETIQDENTQGVNMHNGDMFSDCESQTVCIGDSLVRGLGVSFASNTKGKKRQVEVVPGAKIKCVVDRVKQTSISKDCCLVVNVGSNDVHTPGRISSDDIVRKYKQLIREMKQKSNRCILNGILPRMGSNYHTTGQIIDINKRLGIMCEKDNVGFVDAWDLFEGRKYMLARDGIHLSNIGTKKLGQILNTAVYKFHQAINPLRRPTGTQVDNPLSRADTAQSDNPLIRSPGSQVRSEGSGPQVPSDLTPTPATPTPAPRTPPNPTPRTSTAPSLTTPASTPVRSNPSSTMTRRQVLAKN